METTFALNANKGICENLTQDANDILNKAAFDNNLQGARGAGINETAGSLSCANRRFIFHNRHKNNHKVCRKNECRNRYCRIAK